MESVVPRRYENELRLITSRQGSQYFVEYPLVSDVAHPAAQGNVGRVAHASTATNVLPVAGPGIVGVLVSREVEHGRALVKGILGAVAVVHVKIHNENTLQASLGQGVVSGDGHVVEQAEAHPPAGQGVVARRTHQSEPVVHRTVQYRLDQVHESPRRHERRFVGAGSHVGVQVQMTAAPLRDAAYLFNVARRVVALQPLLGDGRGGDSLQPIQGARLFQQVHDRHQALVVLRVTG